MFRDQTAGTVDTGVTVTNIDCYYIEDGALISAKFDVVAHANGDDAFDDEEGFHMGYGVYRIDFPDAAFDGGVGKRVQLIAIDGDGGAFTEIMEVELSAPVNTVAVGGTTQTANDNGADINAVLLDTGTDGVKIGADAISAAGIADDAFAAEHFATNALTNDALDTTWVTEIWAIAMTDMAAAAPSATAAANIALNWLYTAWRNGYKTDGTNSEIVLYKDDGTTPLVEADIADDGTDFTRQEYGAPD